MTAAGGTPAGWHRHLRAGRLPAMLAVTAGTALLLGGCSNAGSSLALLACDHVSTSIRLYSQAQHATSAAAARAKVEQAAAQLAEALPLAARATSANPVFNPLMTTLQEIGRTSEANLIPALRAQCSAAENPTIPYPVPSTSPSPEAPTGATTHS
jgi:hypothetical protein